MTMPIEFDIVKQYCADHISCWEKDMKIGWITGNQDWAYKNLMEHNSKALPQHQHTTNDYDADVVIAMSPQGMNPEVIKKSILHLDSKRILGL